VEIVSRDRAGAYADAARQGAPQARQIADRFHLQKNVTEALERYLQRKHAVLRQATQIPVALPQAEAAEVAPPVFTVARPTRAQQEQAAHRARRLACYEEVIALHSAGQSLRAIARQTGLAKRTVQRYVHAEGFPEIARRGPRPTLLTPYVPYLQERWAGGCHNAQQLFLELRTQGFSGGRTIVAAFLRQWRTGPRLHARPSRSRPVPAGAPSCPAYSARQTCWLLLKEAALQEEEERAYLARLLQDCPQIAVAQALVKEFATVFDAHDVAGLYSWLRGGHDR
jgi:transposase